MLEHIYNNKDLLAIIIRHSFSKPGVEFVTPPEFSQQLACMAHPKGKKILPHTHNMVPREIHYTQEVLFIRKGKLKVSFYSKEQYFVASRILAAGDVVLLAEGGHSFEVLEDIEMIEVKQGPYTKEQDKLVFEPKVKEQ